MDPGRLKKEFGKVISFWGGGCDTQETLPFGSSEDVRKQVKEMISIFAPGGGYIFSAVHNILADVTPQNIITMYETAKKYGQYPIKI